MPIVLTINKQTECSKNMQFCLESNQKKRERKIFIQIQTVANTMQLWFLYGYFMLYYAEDIHHRHPVCCFPVGLEPI